MQGASVIGTNCGNGIEQMIDIVKEIREEDGNIPILVQANAGIPLLKDNKTFFPETPGDMAGKVNTLVNCGVNIIGGCCGTTPEHITEIVNALKAR